MKHENSILYIVMFIFKLHLILFQTFQYVYRHRRERSIHDMSKKVKMFTDVTNTYNIHIFQNDANVI